MLAGRPSFTRIIIITLMLREKRKNQEEDRWWWSWCCWTNCGKNLLPSIRMEESSSIKFSEGYEVLFAPLLLFSIRFHLRSSTSSSSCWDPLSPLPFPSYFSEPSEGWTWFKWVKWGAGKAVNRRRNHVKERRGCDDADDSNEDSDAGWGRRTYIKLRRIIKWTISRLEREWMNGEWLSEEKNAGRETSASQLQLEKERWRRSNSMSSSRGSSELKY